MDHLRQLLQESQRGSAAALGQLLNLFREDLKNLVRRELHASLRAKADESDIVQQSCVDAQHALTDFEGQSVDDFQKWLREITRKNVLDIVRRFRGTAKRHVGREVSITAPDSRSLPRNHLVSNTPGPFQRAVSSDRRQRIEQILTHLPQDHALVLRARLLEDQPFEEIARELKRTTGATRALFYRALESLKDHLGDEFDD